MASYTFSQKKHQMSEAKKYYEKAKHKDDWGVDVVYPSSVENIIQLSKHEGVLLGLRICKEMFENGRISHKNICEREEYYNGLLGSKMKTLMSDV